MTILCMVYDHPELGMIDYHPGMWMVYLNLHFVCEIFTEDDCDHPVTILCMVYDHPELGMIDYYPGMWMVYLNLILCVKVLLRMIVNIL